MDENNYLKFDKEWNIREKFDSDEKTYDSVIIFKSDGTVFNKTYNRNESWELLNDNEFDYKRSNITYKISFDKSGKKNEFKGSGILLFPSKDNSVINGSLSS